MIITEKLKYECYRFELRLVLMDYLRGASRVDCQHLHREQFPHGLPEQYRRRHHWSIPRRLDLLVDHRPYPRDRMDLDSLSRCSAGRDRVSYTAQPAIWQPGRVKHLSGTITSSWCSSCKSPKCR